MVTCTHVVKRFAGRGGQVAGLDDVSLEIARGEFVAIQGASGSGKSTLLLTLGGMLRPTSGVVSILGQDLYGLSGGERAEFRAANIGFVFQLFHLVPYLDVRSNVLVGLNSMDAAGRERVESLIQDLGLAPRAGELPSTLSAGERQRVALARALVKKPPLILADEPTGNLDPENAAMVFRRLAEYQQGGGTVLVVTHGADAAPHASRVLRLAAGRETDSSGDASAFSPVSSPVSSAPSIRPS